MSFTEIKTDVITFTKGNLEVKIFTTREEMGKEAARNVSETIQQLQIGISASYEETGLIILKNVPIQWDVEP